MDACSTWVPSTSPTPTKAAAPDKAGIKAAPAPSYATAGLGAGSSVAHTAGTASHADEDATAKTATTPPSPMSDAAPAAPAASALPRPCAESIMTSLTAAQTLAQQSFPKGQFRVGNILLMGSEHAGKTDLANALLFSAANGDEGAFEVFSQNRQLPGQRDNLGLSSRPLFADTQVHLWDGEGLSGALYEPGVADEATMLKNRDTICDLLHARVKPNLVVRSWCKGNRAAPRTRTIQRNKIHVVVSVYSLQRLVDAANNASDPTAQQFSAAFSPAANSRAAREAALKRFCALHGAAQAGLISECMAPRVVKQLLAYTHLDVVEDYIRAHPMNDGVHDDRLELLHKVFRDSAAYGTVFVLDSSRTSVYETPRAETHRELRRLLGTMLARCRDSAAVQLDAEERRLAIMSSTEMVAHGATGVCVAAAAALAYFHPGLPAVGTGLLAAVAGLTSLQQWWCRGRHTSPQPCLTK